MMYLILFKLLEGVDQLVSRHLVGFTFKPSPNSKMRSKESLLNTIHKEKSVFLIPNVERVLSDQNTMIWTMRSKMKSNLGVGMPSEIIAILKLNKNE